MLHVRNEDLQDLAWSLTISCVGGDLSEGILARVHAILSLYALKHFVSLTISCVGGDLSEGILARVHAILSLYALKHFVCLERGEREQHLHLQGTFVCRAQNDTTSSRRMGNMFRQEIPITTADNCRVSVRVLTGTQTFSMMLGYCSKDAAKAHYKERSANVTQDELAQGITEYAHVRHNYESERKSLKKTDIFTLAYKFFKANNLHLLDSPPPLLRDVLVWMLQSGKYTIASSWAFGSRGNDGPLDPQQRQYGRSSSPQRRQLSTTSTSSSSVCPLSAPTVFTASNLRDLTHPHCIQLFPQARSSQPYNNNFTHVHAHPSYSQA